MNLVYWSSGIISDLLNLYEHCNHQTYFDETLKAYILRKLSPLLGNKNHTTESKDVIKNQPIYQTC